MRVSVGRGSTIFGSAIVYIVDFYAYGTIRAVGLGVAADGTMSIK